MSIKHKALLNNCVDNDEVILHQREINKDTYICEKCTHYDGRYCMLHTEYGEVCDRDKCDDYVEVFFNVNNN